MQSLIKTLSLSTWNGGPKPNSEVDIVVPAAVTEQFEAGTVGLSSSVMHANLGQSIAQEENYPVYQGKLTLSVPMSCIESDAGHLKLGVQTQPGSMLTIPTRIMFNSSTI